VRARHCPDCSRFWFHAKAEVSYCASARSVVMKVPHGRKDHRVMLRSLFVISCLAVLALVGCGGSSETGTISGNVTLIGGPFSPTDPQSGGTSHKQAGRVAVLDANGHTVVSQRVQSGHGYRFEVAANRYRLVLVGSGGRKECPRTVRVRQGETTRANVTCQIG